MADCSGQQVVTEVAAKWPGVKGLPERANKALTALLEKAFVKQNELRILTTGKAGEGKSTLVNGILGAEVAPVGSHSTICTRSVAGYTKHVQDVPVTVFDSPGLQDTTENEDLYLEEMKEKCQRLSLILYCTKMTNIRLKDEDKNAMKKLTESFGEEFWKFALLVLTFANTEDVTRKDDRDEDAGKPEPHFDDDEGWKELGERRFKGRVNKWQQDFHQFLIEKVGVSAEIAYEIPVIPVGDNKISRNNREPLRLPDRDNWFVEFWKACCLRVNEVGLFFHINCHRMAVAVQVGDEEVVEATEELTVEAIELLEEVAMESCSSSDLQQNESINVNGNQQSTTVNNDGIARPVDETNEDVIDLTQQEIPVTNEFVEEVVRESFMKKYGKKVAKGAMYALKLIPKPFLWIKAAVKHIFSRISR